MGTTTSATSTINYTNQRLQNWYKNAQIDFGVFGSGSTSIDGNEIKINFTESGVQKEWSMCYYPENCEDLDYYFNVWMEQAR